MRLAFILLFVLFSSFSFGQGPANSFEIKEIPQDLIELTEFIEVFEDKEGAITPATILDYDTAFISTASFQNHPIIEEGFLWTRIRLTNKRDGPSDAYLTISSLVDEVWGYSLEKDRLIFTAKSGNKLRPSEKLSSTLNYFHVFLEKGETKTYYFKIRGKPDYNSINATKLYFSSGVKIATKNMAKTIIQSIYFGLLFGLFIFSLFLALLLKNKTIIFFSGLMLSFCGYFFMTYDTLFVLLDFTPSFGVGSYQRVTIGSMIIFGGTFVIRHLQLKTYIPGYTRFLYGLTFSGGLFIMVFRSFFLEYSVFATINNLIAIIFLAALIAPVLMLARWHYNSEFKAMLISMGCLIGGGIIFSVNNIPGINIGEWTGYMFQVGTLLFSSILFYSLVQQYNKMKQEKLKAENLNELRAQFFTNISHEFRTPLTLVLGPIKEVEKDSTSEKNKELLRTAYKNAKHVLSLINSLLDLSAFGEGKMKLSSQQANFSQLIKRISASFDSYAETKGVHFLVDTEKDSLPLYVDIEKIEMLLSNLLSNAFKFTRNEGTITVLVKEKEKEAQLIIQDDGIGIAKENLPFIFDRFYRVESTKDNYEGTGIGLALVKEIVELHKGTIQVASEPGKGTRFDIRFPKGKAHLSNQEIADSSHSYSPDPESKEKTQAQIPRKVVPQNKEALLSDKPKLLIAEDNDELRLYIKNIFDADYAIIEAANGEEGIELAQKWIPDLIITDVMMPKVDGLELCETLKNDENCCLIPIIILSAKASLQSRLDGLNIGAEHYITKPFHAEELKAIVDQSVESRKRIIKEISQGANKVVLKKNGPIKPVDKALLVQVMNCIREGADDSLFSVDSVADQIGISKVHLNRRIKSMVNSTVTKLILTHRLDKSIQLIQEGTLNVNEISEECGFNSPAYFIKCFKDRFDKIPGMLLNIHK